MNKRFTTEQGRPGGVHYHAASMLQSSTITLKWLDPSVVNESDAPPSDPTLDMFNGNNAPLFSREFLTRSSSGQHKRRDRIEAWVWARLHQFRATPGAPRDQAFIAYRTHAEPRCIDLTLDLNDQAPDSLRGDARAVNHSANAFARHTTLSAYLSQWSSRSRADGPSNLARTLASILLMDCEVRQQPPGSALDPPPNEEYLGPFEDTMHDAEQTSHNRKQAI